MDLLSNLFANRISKKMSHHFVGAFDPALSREHGPAKHPADNRLRAGLSLVEVMIALGLLATVISALMGALGSAASANTTADLRERAATASQLLIEQIQAANSLY